MQFTYFKAKIRTVPKFNPDAAHMNTWLGTTVSRSSVWSGKVCQYINTYLLSASKYCVTGLECRPTSVPSFFLLFYLKHSHLQIYPQQWSVSHGGFKEDARFSLFRRSHMKTNRLIKPIFFFLKSHVGDSLRSCSVPAGWHSLETKNTNRKRLSVTVLR